MFWWHVVRHGHRNYRGSLDDARLQEVRFDRRRFCLHVDLTTEAENSAWRASTQLLKPTFLRILSLSCKQGRLLVLYLPTPWPIDSDESQVCLPCPYSHLSGASFKPLHMDIFLASTLEGTSRWAFHCVKNLKKGREKIERELS